MTHKFYGFGFTENSRITYATKVKKDEATEIQWGIRNYACWDDLITHSHTLSRLEQEAQKTIIDGLGYLPNLTIRIPHEVHIRALISMKRQQSISESDFEFQLIQHLKHIRNDDMHKCGWTKSYTANTWALYNSELSTFKEVAQSRIFSLLGYLPAPQNLLEPEMLIRELCSWPNYNPEWEMCAFDYKAFTVIKFREALKSHGEAGASVSSLFQGTK
jgi:hypothetical protein